MATKLRGMLNLTKIPKALITANKNLDKVIWVDIVPNRNGADQYGSTHTIQLYDKENREVIYLGNLKPEEFGSAKANNAPAPSAPNPKDDLPWD